MIPETRGGNRKYDFESMKVGTYKIMNTYNDGIKIRAAATNRGFRIAIRTVDGEVRAYFLGKK
mgnify:CR=1 FL=1